ncbi:hypothetical protein SK128_000415, partial [Halocaridina rubra]
YGHICFKISSVIRYYELKDTVPINCKLPNYDGSQVRWGNPNLVFRVTSQVAGLVKTRSHLRKNMLQFYKIRKRQCVTKLFRHRFLQCFYANNVLYPWLICNDPRCYSTTTFQV